MKTWKKIVLAVAAFLTVLAGGTSVADNLGARTTRPEITLFSTSTVANTSDLSVSNVESYRHVGFTAVAETASGTLQFACSNSVAVPDFSATRSASNVWDYIQVVDLEDGATIDGDTGIALSDTTSVRRFEINVNHSKWCTALLTSNSSPAGLGTTTVYLSASEN